MYNTGAHFLMIPQSRLMKSLMISHAWHTVSLGRSFGNTYNNISIRKFNFKTNYLKIGL